MKTKAQLISDTRWESMYKVSTWFKVHQVQLVQYFEERNPVCKPCLLLLLIAKISTSASIMFRSLQGFSTTLHAQHQGLLKLQGTYAEIFNASAVYMDKYDKTIGAMSDENLLFVAFSDTEGVLEDLGSFAVETLQNLENEEKQLIFCTVSKCAVNLIAGLANIVAEGNSLNEAVEKVPHELPHQFIALRG
jgi:hypothetical protein